MMSAVLLDTLWQGAFVAGIAALLTFLLPQRHAATRYAVWFIGLLALAILPLSSLWHPPAAFGSLPTSVVHTASTASRVTQQAATASGSWLVWFWLAGVTVCLLRLGLSYARIARIIRNATPAPQFGPNVLTSEDVMIPLATGFVSPVVIMPASVAATFDRDDLESIVQHERAHIARMDVAGNFIQRVIEACLFFNPWVYVVGRQLSKEREAACDDWVVHATSDPSRYAICLAHLAQGRRHSHALLLTPSVIGSRHALVGRISRMLNGKETSLKVNYFVVAASMVLFGILALALQVPNGLPSVSAATPSPYLSPACNAAVRPKNPAAPDIAKADYRPHLSATALVTVDPDGHPVSAKIVKSSGSAPTDRATVDAAMHSTYFPAKSNCTAETGQYLFHVETAP